MMFLKQLTLEDNSVGGDEMGGQGRSRQRVVGGREGRGRGAGGREGRSLRLLLGEVHPIPHPACTQRARQ